MKRDWRQILRGVTLRELQDHPDRYCKEPYRTALLEAAAAMTVKFENPIDHLPAEYRAEVHEWPQSAKEALTPGEAVSIIEGLMRVPRSRGGKKTATVLRARAAHWQAECADKAREMLTQGRAPRELSGILAKRFGASPRQVRTVLQQAGLLTARSREVRRARVGRDL